VGIRSRVQTFLGCLGCLTVVVLLAALGIGTGLLTERIAPFFESPEQAVQRYLSAVREDDEAQVRENLCADLNAELAGERLPAWLDEQYAGIGSLQRHESFSTFPFGVDDIRVRYTAQGTLSGRGFTAHMVREDNRWRICELTWSE
jgi:hypothetical protein